MARSLLGGRGAVAAAVVILFLLCAYLYKSPGMSSEAEHPSRSSLPQFKPLPNRQDAPVNKAPIVERSENLRQDTSRNSDHPDMKFLRRLGVDTELPTPEKIKTISDKELTYIYHSYLDNIDFLCRRKIRMGIVGDGGWEVCDDYEYRLMPPCIVYSFGIKNDFSFDDDIGKLYHCDVYSFDPSMEQDSHKRSKYVNFYKLGLRGDGKGLPQHVVGLAKRKNWNMDTLTNIKTMLRHQNKTIDMIKMDIEHSEWFALPSMVAHGELKNVRQLLMEYHLYDSNPDYVRRNMPNLRALHDLGFRRYHTHLNPKCGMLSGVYPVSRTSCYEVYYVNINFARPSPQ